MFARRTSGLFWRRGHDKFANAGIKSDVAHACSVLCRHSCRHPAGRLETRRTNETCRQEWRHGTLKAWATSAMTGQTISHYKITDKLTPNSYNITE